eukprot:Hpha_TRINITY_DN16809_c1_g1::TRINITY_DN16809_c1_g1_i11::g.151843::m.151843/K08900/BCS1; mitochondrial chaperone BCS1
MPPHTHDAPLPLGDCMPMLGAEKFVPVLGGPQVGLWPLGKEVLGALGLTGGDAEYSMVEVSDSRIRSLVFSKVISLRRRDASLANVGSFSVRSMHGGYDSEEEDEEGEERCSKTGLKHTSLTLGKGVHSFQYQGERVWVIQQTLGDPVGTSCGAEMYSSTVLLARGRGREHMLQAMCDSLVAESEKHVENTYQMYQWNVQRGSWRHQGMRTARPVESVVLPAEQRERVVDDFEEFLSKGTRRFYTQHGIPYKRAYLFWGVPGTGKTSLIQALAGKWRRHLCFMQPTDPKFTDDMLKSAVSSAPSRSLIVFEDIDALFTKGRENRGKSAVTFSGLLNALDGVGMPEGQIFVLTTNFREQLDAALIRNGRVDVHVEFKHIADEQCRDMFKRFFPKDAELADEFVERVRKDVGEKSKEMTPAVLQHYFIQQRKLTGREVIDNVGRIAEELARRDDAEKKSEDEKDDKDKDKEEKDEDEDEKKEEQQLKPTHHWHLSVSTSVALTVLGAFCLPILCNRHGR